MTLILRSHQRNNFETRWSKENSTIDESECVVFEDCFYDLTISDISPDGVYFIKVGDDRVGENGKNYRAEVCWPSGMYFESAAGWSDFRVYVERDGEVSELSSVRFYVVPAKISEKNYQGMVHDLYSVCHALLLDIVGKSFLRVGRGAIDNGFLSHEEELMSISASCSNLFPLIRNIKIAPYVTMRMRHKLMSFARAKSPKDVRTFMKRGLSPRSMSSQRKTYGGRSVESLDTPEHRLIKKFLKLLRKRLDQCCSCIDNDIAIIERDRQFRSKVRDDKELSLYESEDIPKILRLKGKRKIAISLINRIDEELYDGFWDDIRESFFMPGNVEFTENIFYQRIATVILNYLRNGAHWGQLRGSEFVSKKSSRMYEQWALLQIVASFRLAGIRFKPFEDVVRDSISRQFGFDFQRGTLFEAEFLPGWLIRIRYEPWILPYSKATIFPHETLCLGGTSETPWSPDIVIELIKDGLSLDTVYSVVIDAKYSRNPREEMRESVRKYIRIRSLSSKKQIVRQVWVLHLGKGESAEGFVLDDDYYSFTKSGVVYGDSCEVVGIEEQVTGDMIVRPPNIDSIKADNEDVSINRVFAEFAKALVNMFHLYIKEL